MRLAVEGIFQQVVTRCGRIRVDETDVETKQGAQFWYLERNLERLLWLTHDFLRLGVRDSQADAMFKAGANNDS